MAAILARIARDAHVTQIVIGQPTCSLWYARLRGSIVYRLLRYPVGAVIHVVPRKT